MRLQFLSQRIKTPEGLDSGVFRALHPMFKYQVPEVPTKIKEIFSAHENFVVVGIGGSTLPLKVFIDALGLADRIHLLDTPDPERIEKILKIDRPLFCVVSKSGETLEIQTLLCELLKRGKKKDLLIVTDPAKGFLRDWATKENLPTLEIPPELGGRFTNFSPFHRALLERFSFPFDFMLSEARKFVSALKADSRTLEWLYQQNFYDKVHNLVLWAYGDRYLGLAEWMQQALAESLGKKRADGKRFGFFPIVLKGPQDNHSVLQLLTDGPQRQAFWLLYSHSAYDLAEKEARFGERLDDVARFSSAEILEILATSTAETFEERLKSSESEQPLVRWEFSSSEILNDIVQAVVLTQAFVEYAASKLEINAFDQPGVERGKQIAREKILARLKS